MTEKEENESQGEGSKCGAVGRRIFGYVVKWLLPLVFTILLLGYLFKKVNFSEVLDIVHKGVDYWWILLAMVLSILSHVIRALRWRMQLRDLGINAPLMALCCSVFGCYALNLVLPRVGEVWRCTYIARRERAPLSTIVGSFMADRLSDTLTVLLLTALAFVVATPALNAFLSKYPVGQGMIAMVTSPMFWVAIVLLVAAVWALFRFGASLRMIVKIRSLMTEVWNGFAAVTRMKGRWLFLFYTLAIWCCYFIQLYVAFFAFDFTRALCHGEGMAFGLVPCLVAFVLSAIGMAIPSNGGLGPWNIAIMFGLSIYGVSDADGTAFSMVQWTGQTVMLIILGIYTMAYIAISKREAK